jgi:hypothetical protein
MVMGKCDWCEAETSMGIVAFAFRSTRLDAEPGGPPEQEITAIRRLLCPTCAQRNRNAGMGQGMINPVESMLLLSRVFTMWIARSSFVRGEQASAASELVQQLALDIAAILHLEEVHSIRTEVLDAAYEQMPRLVSP